MKFTVEGIALEPHAETVGTSDIEKRWPAEEIADAAETLVGKPVTNDTSQSADSVIGQVTDVEWDEERGLIYEAEIADEEVAEKLQNGLGDLAPRMFHEALGTAEINESEEPAVVEDLTFDSLFLCNEPADGTPGVQNVMEENNE